MISPLHRYLVRLANRKNYSPKQTLPLMIEFRKKVDSLGAVVKNMRVTEVAIEFDLYAGDKPAMEKAVEALSQEYGNVLLDRDLTAEETSFPTLYKDKVETVKESVDLFNDQRYWECHEADGADLAARVQFHGKSGTAGNDSRRFRARTCSKRRGRDLSRDDPSNPREAQPLEGRQVLRAKCRPAKAGLGGHPPDREDLLSENLVSQLRYSAGFPAPPQ